MSEQIEISHSGKHQLFSVSPFAMYWICGQCHQQTRLRFIDRGSYPVRPPIEGDWFNYEGECHCGDIWVTVSLPIDGSEPIAEWEIEPFETDAEIDAYLRSVGYDPDELVARMRERIGRALDKSPLNLRNQDDDKAE